MLLSFMAKTDKQLDLDDSEDKKLCEADKTRLRKPRGKSGHIQLITIIPVTSNDLEAIEQAISGDISQLFVRG